MSREWAGLTDVECSSGTAVDTADDGTQTFRGFVTVRAVAADGSIMAGQLDPDTCREMALSFLQVAEAADQDAIVFRILVGQAGLPAAVAANLVGQMRDVRAGL